MRAANLRACPSSSSTSALSASATSSARMPSSAAALATYDITVSISIQYARSSRARISARFSALAGARIPAET